MHDGSLPPPISTAGGSFSRGLSTRGTTKHFGPAVCVPSRNDGNLLRAHPGLKGARRIFFFFYGSRFRSDKTHIVLCKSANTLAKLRRLPGFFYLRNPPSLIPHVYCFKKKERLIFFSHGAYFDICKVSSGECSDCKICIDATKWRYDTSMASIVVSLAFLRVQSQLRYDRYRGNLKEFL